MVLRPTTAATWVLVGESTAPAWPATGEVEGVPAAGATWVQVHSWVQAPPSAVQQLCPVTVQSTLLEQLPGTHWPALEQTRPEPGKLQSVFLLQATQAWVVVLQVWLLTKQSETWRHCPEQVCACVVGSTTQACGLGQSLSTWQ
jgi:hypothetical protein